MKAEFIKMTHGKQLEMSAQLQKGNWIRIEVVILMPCDNTRYCSYSS